MRALSRSGFKAAASVLSSAGSVFAGLAFFEAAFSVVSSFFSLASAVATACRAAVHVADGVAASGASASTVAVCGAEELVCWERCDPAAETVTARATAITAHSTAAAGQVAISLRINFSGVSPNSPFTEPSPCLTPEVRFPVASREPVFYRGCPAIGSTVVLTAITVAVASAIREPSLRFSTTAMQCTSVRRTFSTLPTIRTGSPSFSGRR